MAKEISSYNSNFVSSGFCGFPDIPAVLVFCGLSCITDKDNGDNETQTDELKRQKIKKPTKQSTNSGRQL